MISLDSAFDSGKADNKEFDSSGVWEVRVVFHLIRVRT